MDTERMDVVICGAGIGGLAAAHALGRLGLRVLVIERRVAPPRTAKGELIPPAATAALDDWGVLPALRAAGAVGLGRMCIREPAGRAVLDLAYGTLPGAHREIVSVGHATLLHTLADRLGPTVEVRHGVRVVEPLRNGGGRVTGVRIADGRQLLDVPARLVVAADGVSSRLRHALLLPVDRRRYRHRLLAVEIADAAPPVAGEVTAYRTRHGLRLVYPLPGGHCRLYAQVGAEEFAGGVGDLGPWADRLLAGTPALAPLAGPLRESLHRRQLFAAYRVDAYDLATPGMALVGEAANAMHPMAGQGVNSAVADARALAGHLVAAGGIEAAAVDRALRGYVTERIAGLARTAAVSDDAARMLTGTTGVHRWLGGRLVRRAAADPRALRRRVTDLAGFPSADFAGFRRSAGRPAVGRRGSGDEPQ